MIRDGIMIQTDCYYLIFRSFYARKKKFQGLPLMARMVAFFDPPYANVKIAFRIKDNDTQLLAYTISSEGLQRGVFDFRPSDFKFLCFKPGNKRVKKLLEICEDFYLWKIGIELSYMKMSRINAPVSLIFPCIVYRYPTFETEYWMCSEWVTFVLQQASLIQIGAPDIHPSYTSPTDLFRYTIYFGKGFDINDSFNPVSKRKGNEYDSNAVVFYKKLMFEDETQQIPKLGKKSWPLYYGKTYI